MNTPHTTSFDQRYTKKHQEIALKCAEVIAKVFSMANKLTQQK